MCTLFTIGGIMWFLGVLYALWLLIFPILVYTRMGEILTTLNKIEKK
ncbi:MAG: hypothetical protein HQ558_04305 [Candidatus Omnitrophica bacterium]|nr:hypothetical protein [Candidatus Omnitrophota bacterium]